MNFTYEELEKFVEEEWEQMHEDEKYHRLKDCDPTYANYVLSVIPKGSDVYVDFETYNYIIRTKSKDEEHTINEKESIL